MEDFADCPQPVLSRRFSDRFPVEEEDDQGVDSLTPRSEHRGHLEATMTLRGTGESPTKLRSRPPVREANSDMSAELSSLSAEDSGQASPFSANVRLQRPIAYLADDDDDQ